MKKILYSIILIFTALFFYGASLVANKHPFTLTDPQFSGLYVDNFDQICGVKQREDSLLNYCKKTSVNWIYLYDLNAVTSAEAGRAKLAAFNTKFHTNSIKISAVYGSTSSLQKRIDYQTSHTLSQRFDGFNLEAEYWNGAISGTEWRSTLLKSWQYTTVKAIKNDYYIGTFKNSGIKDTTQCNFIVSASNRGLIHCYIDSARIASTDGAWTYVKERVNELGIAAIKAHKIYNVEIIFAKTYKIDSETTINNGWFKTHTSTDALNKVKTSAAKSSWSGKKGINFEGKIEYNYTNWK